VTESDLRDARVAVAEQVERRRQRNRRRGVVAAAAAAAVVVGVATWQGLSDEDPAPSPAPPVPSPSGLSDEDAAFLTGEAPTPDLLQGVWRLDNPTSSHLLVLFTADGAIAYDDTGELSKNPLATGTYVIDGDTIEVTIESGPVGCTGRTLAVHAAVSENGTLPVLPIDFAGGACGLPLRSQWVLEQLLPTSEVYAGFRVPPGNSWDPPAGGEIVGVWFDPAGHFLFELRTDGTYSALTGALQAADVGTWVDDSSTRLTMTSSAQSATCRQGDQLVLSRLRARDVGVLALQADLERNDCDLPWTGKGWFRLAP
jgi:hypothetical protein